MTTGIPADPSPETIAELLTQWVDPVIDEPAGTKYCLYPTPRRGENTQGSYLIAMPPGYEEHSSKRYPVIYWLHGGLGNARQGAWAVQHYGAAMQTANMPEAIIVLVQALPVGWYVDSKDGKLPIEQVIIHDLIPHIDATYRTISHPGGRGIEGHSMGGFGSLHLGLKFPHLFGAVSAVAPSILRNLSEEPLYRTFYTFDGDQNYYEEVGPWRLAERNAEALKQAKTRMRILSGGQDRHLRATLEEYHLWLTNCKVEHRFTLLSDVGHGYQEIIENAGSAAFDFWTNAFSW